MELLILRSITFNSSLIILITLLIRAKYNGPAINYNKITILII